MTMQRMKKAKKFVVPSLATLAATAAMVAAPTSPAQAEATWDFHWIQNEGSTSKTFESHDASKAGTGCGGFRGASYGGDQNWLIVHSHQAATFTVSPAGGPVTFSYTTLAYDGVNAGGPASTATLFAELEADLTTGESWPEGSRPQYFTTSTMATNNTPVTQSFDLTSRAGHRVKLQFRCAQTGVPSSGGSGSSPGTSFSFKSFAFPE